MENSINYQKHVNIVKDLNLYTNVGTDQRPIEKEYEEIYAKAKESDITLKTAKSFLDSLSKYELSILRKFDGLVDTIDVDILSNEGAYNLIVHNWEEYDFNNDGVVSVGVGDMLATVPRQMDDEAKKTWVKTLNSMDIEKDFMSIGVIVMSFYTDMIKYHMAESLSQISEVELDAMQKNASYDIRSFISETLSQPYNPKTITVLDILDTIDNVINPSDGGYSSPELIQSTKRLKDALESAYAEVQKEAKQAKISTQKELEIKQDLIDKSNEIQEQPLAVVLQSVVNTSNMTNKEIIAEYRALPGQNGVLLEGMFEAQQASSLAKHEPYFKAQYEYYEKYKDIFTPVYSNYTTEKANSIGRELNAQFPEFGAMKEKAYMGGTQKEKNAFEDMFWDYQAFNKFLREKYDMDMSTGGFMAASKESSKAYNYAIYDGLENGLSLKDATAKASGILASFGGNEAMSFSLLFLSGLPEDIQAVTEIPKEDIDYDKQIDLRDYGFTHNFWSDAYINTYGDDSIGVKSRIMYEIKLYSFLLENEDVIDSKLEELKARAYETENGKDWYDWQNQDGNFNESFKSQFQLKHDNAVYAKEIYDKYSSKIFDNLILDKYDE